MLLTQYQHLVKSIGRKHLYRSIIKPITDKTLAAILLVLFSPFLLVGILLATVASKGRPFFLHQRPGIGCEPITILKLTTMGPPEDAQGNSLSNAERVSVIGGWLRKTSIDELPQLINVLKGDLSLVGPRPLEMRYLPHYSEHQNRRHEVLPGITGLAQVSGRNKLSWEEKFELDVEYVDNVSFLLDLKILLRTVKRVFDFSDVNASHRNTMKPFA